MRRYFLKQPMCQEVQFFLIPVGHRVFPAVPEGFTTQPRQFTQPPQVVTKLKNRAAIALFPGDDLGDLGKTVFHDDPPRNLEQEQEN